jgi:hypothetical protein
MLLFGQLHLDFTKDQLYHLDPDTNLPSIKTSMYLSKHAEQTSCRRSSRLNLFLFSCTIPSHAISLQATSTSPFQSWMQGGVISPHYWRSDGGSLANEPSGMGVRCFGRREKERGSEVEWMRGLVSGRKGGDEK